MMRRRVGSERARRDLRVEVMGYFFFRGLWKAQGQRSRETHHAFDETSNPVPSAGAGDSRPVGNGADKGPLREFLETRLDSADKPPGVIGCRKGKSPDHARSRQPRAA